MKRNETHQLAELEEVRHATGVLERLIQLGARTKNSNITPELVSQFGNDLECLRETRAIPRHAAVLPHRLAELAMERRHCAAAFHAEQSLGPRADVGLRSF